MKKEEFLVALQKGLVGLPQEDIDKVVEYYAELLADRVEDGETEENAVAAMPSVEEIREKALEDIPLTKLMGIKLKPKRKLETWEILLLALGSPIWLALLITFAAVIVTLYVVLWTHVIVLIALMVAVIAIVFAELVVGVATLIQGVLAEALVCFGFTLIGVGLSVFLFPAVRWTGKGMFVLTKKMVLIVKKIFVKEKNNG